MAAVIELTGITKRFPGVLANDQVSLAVAPGEIHALVGENGAGKSTLMKILYGLYQPDSGSIAVRGQPVVLDSPRRAISLGIGMVHQHFMLIPVFTVAENVVLGSEPARRGRLAPDEARRRVRELCDQYGFVLDPDAELGALSVGEQQRVEIIKVLYRGAEVLILDEPTAVLTPQEVDDLFANLRRLRAEGKTIVFISHILEEVLAIADRITVLRRGQVVGMLEAARATKAQIAEMMVGRPILMELPVPEVAAGEPRLVVEGAVIAGARGRPAVRGLSFAVRSGEVYGIAGVEGNGQSELVEALVGLRPLVSGRLLIMGRDVTRTGARGIRLLGVAHIPEDRHRRGLVLAMEVWENLILGHHTRPIFGPGLLLDRTAIERFAQERVARFDVRTPSLRTPTLALSGGNQQKLIVAREFAFDPSVLVAAQPTRGLDIGATEFVRRQILDAKAAGMAVVLVSAMLEEILTLADRIGVIHAGQIVAEFARGAATPREIGLYMTGARQAEVRAG
ncbi:MAG: ABC transporter ATP-binding protein [Armatimonadetes bacterium]|nr:ABC transporter ATP-binding protein [Armatimonadota bacterium]